MSQLPPSPPVQPFPPYAVQPNPYAEAASKKLSAGLCAILIGGLGIHKFILGYTTAGIVMLLVTLLSCGVGAVVMHVISIIEGITYLTKSDMDFHNTYIAGQKEWF